MAQKSEWQRKGKGETLTDTHTHTPHWHARCHRQFRRRCGRLHRRNRSQWDGLHIVGDRLKPRKSQFFRFWEKRKEKRRKERKKERKKTVLKIQFLLNRNIRFFSNTCIIVSTYVCVYDFSWRKRVSYERFLLDHEDTCFLSITPDP